MFDIAVIGAGISGLVCARQLATAGYQVVVVEKSRGLGGRMATRRLHSTVADHGVSYLTTGEILQQLVQVLSDRHLLQVWTDTVHDYSNGQLVESGSPAPRYIAPAGMSSIAKFLATGLDIWLNQRVQTITLTADNCWQILLEPTEATSQELTAKAVVIAIPAPQALMILPTDVNTEFSKNLRSVEFNPCLSVIAGYSLQLQPTWRAVTFLDLPDLAWIGLDSSKRLEAELPVFVLHSSPKFAQQHLDSEDLQLLGKQLLAQASSFLPGLDTPEWVQVHRWRYAFPRVAWHETYLSAAPLPLVCCGDWCGGNRVESALVSGCAAAAEINSQLEQRSLPDINFKS